MCQERGLLSPWWGTFGAEASGGQPLEDVGFTGLNQFLTYMQLSMPSPDLEHRASLLLTQLDDQEPTEAEP